MLTEKTFKPAGSKKCQDALAIADVGEILDVVDDFDHHGGYMLIDSLGDPVGYLSPTHWVSMDLWRGRHVLHASVASVSEDYDGNHCITVRLVTGDDNDEYAPALPAAARTEAPTRTYSVNIVGESYRQDAIGRTQVGERAILLHDADNQFDPRAIAVFNAGREQIGFLERDGWLTAALLDEGRSYSAHILEIHRASGKQKHAAVILTVELG